MKINSLKNFLVDPERGLIGPDTFASLCDTLMGANSEMFITGEMPNEGKVNLGSEVVIWGTAEVKKGTKYVSIEIPVESHQRLGKYAAQPTHSCTTLMANVSGNKYRIYSSRPRDVLWAVRLIRVEETTAV